jgi:L-seryl-tRNA(Ser) seleniumtransferase
MSDLRRRVPSLDALLRSDPGRRASESLGRPLMKTTLATTLHEVRAAAARGVTPPADDEILARAAHLASTAVSGLTPVVNATGVILHTNLGRAPLPARAVRAAARAGGSFTDLEIDRETGRRGKRSTRAELLLTALTGAEAALVVNNCAAALMLALAGLARRKEVVVSRGELIEIGGEFRIPDIMAASGAKLVEVGTTNRTRARDYANALGPRTGAILKVHPSNYRVVGFTASPDATELATLAAAHGVPFLYDVGSGLLRGGRGTPAGEPSVAAALADGADLVTCSGDKLLGGPQAGILAGRAELVERLRRHPIARAVRVDKMQVAALESVLTMLVKGAEHEIPVRHMLSEPASAVRRRALEVVGRLASANARIVKSSSVVGGGSMPGVGLPSWAIELTVSDPGGVAARLRQGVPSVLGRVEDGRILLDLRTVLPTEHDDLARAVRHALEGDRPQDR